MFYLKRMVAVAVIGCFVAVGTLAQKKGDRPPKQPNTVVVAPKGQKPPPSNNNRGDKKPDGKKGKN